MAGVEEVVRVIRGEQKVDLQDLAKSLLVPGKKIMERRMMEQGLTEKDQIAKENLDQEPTPTMSAEEIDKYRKEEEERGWRERRLKYFVETGELLNMGFKSDSKEMSGLARLRSMVVG